MASSDEFLNVGPWKVWGTLLRSTAPDARPAVLARLEARDFGTSVRSSRSSWTSRGMIAGIDCHVKVYDYPTARDRRRGWLRTTWLTRSRAGREHAALRWLDAQGLAAPTPCALAESRNRLGVLHRSILVTRTWPGTDLERLLPTLAAVERAEVLAATREYVDRLHGLGFRDRNLDLRNLLARKDETGAWEIAKLDSPRHRLTRPGPRVDRLVVADRSRLAADLARLDLPSLWSA